MSDSDLKKQLHNSILYREKLLQELYSINDEIENIKHRIYQDCKHTWVIDRTSYSERTEYYCSQCGSYKY